MNFLDSSLRLPVVSVDFEICGVILGLYFMKHCKDECNKLGLKGWIKTGVRGNIFGKIQGQRSKVGHMINWLSTRGSPGSRIDDCQFYNYIYLSEPDFHGFTLRF